MAELNTEQITTENDRLGDSPTTAALNATLHALGVPYLRSRHSVSPLDISLTELVGAMARQPEPRMREALIPLFLRHPELSSELLSLLPQLDVKAQTTLKHMYTAAVYLQRLWRSQLHIRFGQTMVLPDLFGQSEWLLPHPDLHFGELGLLALARMFQQKSGDNWLATYRGVIDTFLKTTQRQTNESNIS